MEDEFRKDRSDSRWSNQQSDRTQELQIEDDAVDGSRTPKRRVPVVEDEEPLRVLASVFLVNAGYEVVDVCSAEDAIVLLSSEPFDLVFSDIGLKEALTGIHLLHWVRAHHPEIPVILNSGQPLDPEARVGDVMFLPKPWRSSQLLDAVAREMASTVAPR